MRVLHINAEELNGGAARAAKRLHNSLLKKGIDSRMLVMHRQSDEKNTITFNFGDNKKITKAKKFINSRSEALWMKLAGVNTNTPWSINRLIFSSNISIIANTFDVINLHWINGGMFDIQMLSEINKPIVWTLHDMWPFTGGCHYISDGCRKYLDSCFKCNQLYGRPKFDLSKFVFNRKKLFYKTDINCISPSKWLAEEAKKSFLMKNMDIHVIPNCIDVTTFSPVDKVLSRNILGLPIDSKIILFGAMNATSDSRKGFQYLKNALKILYQNHSATNTPIELLVFGASESDEMFDFPIHFVGRLYDDISLAILYSAADLMVVPSHLDNLPNTIMEALSCGTPCVGFNIGGIPDMIIHGENGMLAKPYDENDLANCIWSILSDHIKQMHFSKNARTFAVKNFNEDLIAERYINIYNELM